MNPAGSCPHDLGGPIEDPFVVPNSYIYRNSTIGKDLNCDLVPCLCREAERMAAAWRGHHFPAVVAAIKSYSRRLFNGRFNRVDTGGPFSEASFIEQLFGPFLARRHGLGDIVPDADARAAFLAVCETSFTHQGQGMGAVLLAAIPDAARHSLPHTDDTGFQTSEIRSGFNFGFAAQLEEWGLRSGADTLRRAVFHQLYEQRNLIFRSPAVFDTSGPTARASPNMRPRPVWWMS